MKPKKVWARPFHQGETCNYVGGIVPFAKDAVRNANERAVKERFLLPQDAQQLVQDASQSRVLR